MTTDTTNRPRPQFRFLAFIGLLGLIIVIAWLGIQIVKVAPSAFSSLASIADSIYRYTPTTAPDATFTTTVSPNAVGPDVPFVIAWDAISTPGSFALSYTCVTGLSLDIKDALGSVRSLSCDTNYNLGNVTAIDMLAVNTTDSDVTLVYAVDFVPSGTTEPTHTSSGNLIVAGVTPPSTLPPPAVTPTTTPVVTTPKPTRPVVTPTAPVAVLPVSDPAGFTDLVTTFIGVGSLTPDNTFRNTGVIEGDTRGAISFAVKNDGTKTSGCWTYTLTLPTGDTYTSPTQAPLKPNERAVITIGFAAPQTTASKRVTIEALTTGDKTPRNNRISLAVAVRD